MVITVIPLDVEGSTLASKQAMSGYLSKIRKHA